MATHLKGLACGSHKVGRTAMSPLWVTCPACRLLLREQAQDVSHIAYKAGYTAGYKDGYKDDAGTLCDVDEPEVRARYGSGMEPADWWTGYASGYQAGYDRYMDHIAACEDYRRAESGRKSEEDETWDELLEYYANH